MDSINEWIPTYLCYNGYKRMLSTVYQMNAEKRPVTAEDVAKDMELMKRSANAGLTFLKSINIIEGDIEYRLTRQGLEYAHAVSGHSSASIKRSCYEILKHSRLKNIVRYLEANRYSVNVEQLYAIVKKEANIPDGKGPFGMKASHATGVDSLLHILKSAGLIPVGIELEKALESEMKEIEKRRAAAGSVA